MSSQSNWFHSLREPPALRIRIMMYLMTALLIYFIYDRCVLYYTPRFDNLQKDIQEKIVELETLHALMNQIPLILEKQSNIQKEIIQIESKIDQWYNNAIQCDENKLVDIFNKQGEEALLYQFKVHKTGKIGKLDHYTYNVKLQGKYMEIMGSLRNLHRSACQNHLSSWTLYVETTDREKIAGELEFSIFRPNREAQ